MGKPDPIIEAILEGRDMEFLDSYRAASLRLGYHWKVFLNTVKDEFIKKFLTSN